MFNCQFCNKQYKTRHGVTKHQVHCGKIVHKDSIDQFHKDVDVLRNNALSIWEFFDDLADLLFKHKVHVEFNNVPLNFSTSIESLHINSDCNETNPGFLGLFRGTFRPDKDNTLGLPEDAWFSSLDCKVINTLSGNPGQNFHVNGVLWLDDFPKIADAYLCEGSFISTQANEFKALIDTYHDAYKASKNNYVNSSSEMKQVTQKIVELNALLEEASGLKGKLQYKLSNDFNNQYNIDIPRVKYPFILSDTANKIFQMKQKRDKIHPDLNIYFNNIVSKSEDIRRFIETFPELYL